MQPEDARRSEALASRMARRWYRSMRIGRSRAMVEFDGLIEAGEDAWLWYARTARDRAVVSVFCDPRRLRAGKRGGMQAKYSGLLRQFRALKLEQLGEQCSDPQACDATSQHAEDPVGDRYIRLGDSCFSVDPLSSQGVHLALQSGLQGAIIVNTMLRKPENTAAAQRFFRMRIAERVGRYTGRTKARVCAGVGNVPERILARACRRRLTGRRPPA